MPIVIMIVGFFLRVAAGLDEEGTGHGDEDEPGMDSADDEEVMVVAVDKRQRHTKSNYIKLADAENGERSFMRVMNYSDCELRERVVDPDLILMYGCKHAH
jgi:hypothetical protein